MRSRRADDGGLPARRAVVRWSWRLFRQEWRQQVLVLLLITVAVAMTVAGASAAYNMAPSGDARFGSASHRLVVDGADPDEAAIEVDAIEAWFGPTEQIRTWTAEVPGSADQVEVRAQDPEGRFGRSLLAVRDGRYPTGRDEIAVTDDVAETFGVGAGSTLRLRGRDWAVVGLVEDPEDLDDEFALVGPALDGTPDTVEVLVDTTDDEVRARPQSGSDAASAVEVRGTTEKGTAALAAYLVSTVVLLLVALVAAAGFVVMAHRRQRQIGLLAATGATDRHLRLVMVANGVTVGVVAAVVGAAAGLLLWIGLAGAVEPAAGHRIDRFDVPWWVVVAGMALAVCAATAASWWPARAVARLPVTAALSARPAAPLPARRSTLLAGGLLGVGAAAITWSDPNRTTLDPQPFRDIVMVAGVVAIALGVLLLGPIVLRSVGRAARRLPVTGRLALRDLARFQARSGMALGAVSLAVGIPIAIVITAGAVEAGEDEGNLSDRDLVLRIGDTGGPMVEEAPAGDVDALAAQVQHVARDLDGAAVVELEMAMEPGSRPPPGFDVREAVAVGYPVGENTLRDVVAYVATPELLDHLGVDPGLAEGGADVLTVRTEPLFVISAEDRTDPEALTSARLDVPRHSSGPTTLITPEVVGRRGWDTVTAGWLVSAPSPLTGDQVREARDVAAAAGMTLEARNEGSSGSLRQGAIGAGSLLALAVVAMTVGLVRSEATGDLRTLAVTGATSTMRRRLTAWTAGALGLLGVVLGALGAYVGLASGFARELGALGDVPLGELAVIAAGVPLLAAGAGWALGGREPSSLTRPDG